MEFNEVTLLVFITTLTIFISGAISPIIQKLLYKEKGYKRFLILAVLAMLTMIYLIILMLIVETLIFI